MSDQANRLLNRIRQEIDELKLQMALGKAEASDYLEEQKGKFREQLEHTKERLEKNPLIDKETTSFLKGRLDELRLQLALGKMESREAYQEQRAKIDEAIGSVKKGAEPLKNTASDAIQEFVDLFERGADSFRAKLGAFGVNLRKEEGSEDDGAEGKEEQQAVEIELEVLSEKAHRAGEATSPGAMEQLGKELDGAYRQVRDRLGNLFKK